MDDRYDQVLCTNNDSQESFGAVESTSCCELFLTNEDYMKTIFALYFNFDAFDTGSWDLLAVCTSHKKAEQLRDSYMAEPTTRSYEDIDNYLIKPLELNRKY